MSTARVKNSLEVIRRIYRVVRGYGRRALVYTLGFIVLQAFVQLAGVASIGPFVAAALDPEFIRTNCRDFGLREVASWSDGNLVLLFGMILIGINLVSCVINIAAIQQRASYSNAVGFFLRIQIVGTLLATPYERFIQRNPSILFNTLQASTERFANVVLLEVLELFSRALLIVCLVGAMLVVSPLITFAGGLVIGASYGFIYWFLESRCAVIRDETLATGRGTMKTAQELVSGLKPIRASNAEVAFAAAYLSLAQRRAKSFASIPLYQQAPKHIVEFVSLVTVVAVFSFLAASSSDFASFLPKIGVLSFAIYKLLPQVQMAYVSATSISTALNALDEVEEELQLAPEKKIEIPALAQLNGVHVPPLSFRKTITLDDIHYQYPNTASEALHVSSLEIRHGSSIGICGPSGSGKSTLVDVLLGLLEPKLGRILIDGVPLTSQTLASWRATIGYVPQDIFLLDDTMARNVSFFYGDGAVDLDRVRWACRLAQLEELISSLPQGLETPLGDRGVRLSGGQRQRVALARAIYRRPQLLVLDEATSALDSETEAAFIRALGDLHGQITMVMIAHRLNTLEICDEIYRLADGQVTAVPSCEPTRSKQR